MEPKAKTIEEAAIECAAQLTDEQKNYLRQHLNYSHHHFGYGLYLRNRYSYLFDHELLRKYGDSYRDDFGKKIYYLIIPIIFSEYKGHEKYIERLTYNPFEELTPNYYLKFGRNFIVDVPPGDFLFTDDLDDTSIHGDDEIYSWWENYSSENKKYAAEIAEHIWEYESFRNTATKLGYTENEIEETHQSCIELLKEKSLFVPLEILFAKNTSPESYKAMMRYPDIIERLFSKDESKVGMLPQYVFKNKDIVKIMVSINGSLLKLATEFSADHDIVMTAVRSSTAAADYMDTSLWGNRTIAEEAARNSKYDLMFEYDAFKQFNDDDEIVMLALEANGANICCASKRIRSDYDMALFALQHQRDIYPDSAYQSLSRKLRNRKDLALVELQAPDPSLEGFTKKMLDDDDIAEQLIANEKITWMFYEMSDRIKRKYLDKLPKHIKEGIKEELHIE